MQECKSQGQDQGDIRNDHASNRFSDEVEYDPQLDAFHGFYLILLLF
jgi:hypothetical protein